MVIRKSFLKKEKKCFVQCWRWYSFAVMLFSVPPNKIISLNDQKKELFCFMCDDSNLSFSYFLIVFLLLAQYPKISHYLRIEWICGRFQSYLKSYNPFSNYTDRYVFPICNIVYKVSLKSCNPISNDFISLDIEKNPVNPKIMRHLWILV